MKKTGKGKKHTSVQVEEYIYREYKLNPEFPVAAFTKENYTFTQEPAITWLHFHNCMELMYCYEERIVNIENRVYFMEPGSICVIPPNQMHNSRSEIFQEPVEHPPCEYLYLDPHALISDFFTETYSFQNVFEQINGDLKNVITEQENPVICRLTALILDEMRKPNPSLYMVKGLFLSFWIELLRTLKLPSIRYMAKRRELTEIYPAMSYIREYFTQEISTETLAEICHMSTSQFRQNFKKCLTVSPRRYIDNLRLSKSCQLLLETEMGILDIALQCGYNSLSSYNSHFTARYGVSPTKWKKARRNIKKRTYSHSVYRMDGKEGAL